MSRSAACDIDGLTGIVFSGLSSLVIDDVTALDGVIVVRARTAAGSAPCPRCCGRTGQVLADALGVEPIDLAPDPDALQELRR